jgi:uncharacterized protein
MERAPVQLAGLPSALEWDGAHQASASVTPGGLHMAVSTTSDLFRDPSGRPPVLNAPRLLFEPAARFTLSAHVAVAFRDTFDAGVLLVYIDESAWAKLCLERSPQGQPMVVSVVTDGRSDDANAVVLDGPQVVLRVTGLGGAFAFHFSVDGAAWQLVRYFTLPQPERARVGFSVQAPVGTSCEADFTNVRYAPTAVADIRSGE